LAAESVQTRHFSVIGNVAVEDEEEDAD